MSTEQPTDHTLLGYARVSTLEQDVALQRDALRPLDATASSSTRLQASSNTVLRSTPCSTDSDLETPSWSGDSTAWAAA